MSPVDAEHFRKLLLDERKRITDALDYVHEENPHLDPDASEIRVDNHMAEGASLLVDQEIDDSLMENAERQLAEIDAALARIDQGTYGICESCGREIAPERLEALPYATECIDCRRRERA